MFINCTMTVLSETEAKQNKNKQTEKTIAKPMNNLAKPNTLNIPV